MSVHYQVTPATEVVCDAPRSGERRTSDSDEVTCPDCRKWILARRDENHAKKESEGLDFSDPKFWEDLGKVFDIIFENPKKKKSEDLVHYSGHQDRGVAICEANEKNQKTSTNPLEVTCKPCLRRGWGFLEEIDFEPVVSMPETMKAMAPPGWVVLVNGEEKGASCIIHKGDTIEVCMKPKGDVMHFERSGIDGSVCQTSAGHREHRTTILKKVTCPECLKIEGVQYPPETLFSEFVKKEPEVINHPAHYGGDVVYEVIKVIDAWKLGFNLGNAVKYIGRAHRKDKQIEDLEKAAWYLNHEIEKIKQAPLEVTCPRCGATPGCRCVNEKAVPGRIEEPLLLEPEHSHEERKAP